MNVSPLSDESPRIEEVRRFRIHDTLPDPAFERLTRLAARLFDVPVAIIKLIDADRQWIESSYGLDFIEPQRGATLGDAVNLSDEVFVVPDASQDARFAANPLVTGETAIRFYAGAPLKTRDGFNVGTFAIMDTAPRELGAAERGALTDLAALAVEKIEPRLLPGSLLPDGLHETGQERQVQDLLLQQGEDPFRALVENAADILGVVDGNGTMRYQSPSIEKLLGYAPAELNGQNAFDLIHPDDAPHFGETLTRASQAPGETFSVEYRFQHRDGSWRTLESTGKTLMGGAHASGVVLSSRDITQRKVAEAVLQAAKDQLQVVLDTIPGGVTWVSRDLRYLGVNRYLTEYFKMAAENFIGRPIGFMGIGSDYEEAVRVFFEGGSQQTSFEAGLDVDGMRRTILVAGGKYQEGAAAVLVGIDITERRAAQAALQLAHDELESRVAGRTVELAELVETLRGQIAERRQTEAALRASEAQFRVLTEAIPQQVWTADPDGTPNHLNQRTLEHFGLTYDRMLTGDWVQLIHPDDVARTVERWTHSLKTGELYETEFRVKSPHDETFRWYLSRALPLRDGEGRIVKWFGTNTDISERKKAEEELQKTRARLQFVLSATPAVIYTAQALPNPRTTFISENVRQQLGYEPQEILENPTFWIEHLHPDDKAGVFATAPRLFEADSLAHEYRMRRRDGAYCWIYDEMKLVRDEAGRPLEIVGFALDITKRKKAEE
ncbi:MAG: PAS domain-containing protein, partial [Armatimonadetes bacterium]|nr:PAS domain-containing protein [Armatimonadota bacterium]